MIFSWKICHLDHRYMKFLIFNLLKFIVSFPGGSVVKNPPANAEDAGLIPGSGRYPGEGNGNPLQDSCLENSMDRGAWHVTVHGVAKSWMWLSDKTVTTRGPSSVLRQGTRIPQVTVKTQQSQNKNQGQDRSHAEFTVKTLESASKGKCENCLMGLRLLPRLLLAFQSGLWVSPVRRHLSSVGIAAAAAWSVLSPSSLCTHFAPERIPGFASF